MSLGRLSGAIATFTLSVICQRVEVPLAGAAEAVAVIRADQEAGKISRHLYGHFAEHLGRCIYDGIWVGADSQIPNIRGIRTDIVEALKAIHIPNLRWPGGCFADDYHWRDGIGPREQRPRRVNLHWGKVIETNAFGTHEFLDLCEMIGAEPYLAGNVGSGTPQEMRDWIEYMTFDGDSELANLRRAHGRAQPWKVKYFGVGNENWGCGGNMRPEFYADLYRQFATFCHEFSGNQLVRVGCGPSGHDRNWTQVVMQRAGRQMQAYSLHYYTLAAPWHDKLPATGFEEAHWFGILKDAQRMEEAIQIAAEEMDRVDPDQKIGLFVDEWGTWYRTEPGHPGYGLYQQNSLRDALVAALTLHIFHEHNDRVRMANIAQTVNVLQAMILTDGPRMLRTPTYHVFDMLQVHHDATRLPVHLNSPKYAYGDRSMPALSVSASRDAEEKIHVSIVNTHPRETVQLACDLSGVQPSRVAGRILTAQQLDAHNTFDAPEMVRPQPFRDASLADDKLTVKVPPRTVLVLELQ
jgi:alpha-N-arabinofuranosidase